MAVMPAQDEVKLRSIELDVPDAAGAAAFMTGVWGAIDSGGSNGARYLRGSGALPYLVGLREAPAPAVRSLTFTTSSERIGSLSDGAAGAGLALRPVRSDDPGGGEGIEIVLPEGERFRFLTGVEDAQPASNPDAPVRLTHIVLNSADAEHSADACEQALGFRVSDRTKGMVFVRCNRSHHSIAFARAGYTSLNHIAFEMQDIDAVMRGMGRMRDAGFEPAWGPGRHGPGANVFAYYVAPFGAVIEFSTAVETVEDDHVAGAPDDWTWPANRIDRWGISNKDFDALGIAERMYRFPVATGADA